MKIGELEKLAEGTIVRDQYGDLGSVRHGRLSNGDPWSIVKWDDGCVSSSRDAKAMSEVSLPVRESQP